jgi:hypothetical protein
MRRGRGWTVLVVGIVAGLVAGGAASWAAIPHSSTKVISACYITKNGKLRVVDAQLGQACKKNEKALAWNQAGPPGASSGFGTFYSAATFRMTPTGCPANQYRLVIGRHWGAAPVLTDNECAAPADPGWSVSGSLQLPPEVMQTEHATAKQRNGFSCQVRLSETPALASCGLNYFTDINVLIASESWIFVWKQVPATS